MAPLASVSVAILTADESTSVAECLDATLAQLAEGDEIVVVDAGSRERVRGILESYARKNPGVVRVHAFPVRVSAGEARQMAVELAKHDLVAFVSASAVPEPEWLSTLRAKAARADVVYGLERHAPSRANAAGVIRGLRAHRRQQAETLPEAHATHANVLFSRFALQQLPIGDDHAGADAAALGREARLAGLRIAYAPDAAVDHRARVSLSGEWRTHVQDGAAQAKLRALLGAPRAALLWALSVGVLGVLAVVLANLWVLALCVTVFFAPTLRSLASPLARRYAPPQLVAGAAVRPVFDLAFVGGYLTQRLRTRG